MEGSTPSVRLHRTVRVNVGPRLFNVQMMDVRSSVRSSVYQGPALCAVAGMAQREEGAQDISEITFFSLAWRVLMQADRYTQGNPQV